MRRTTVRRRSLRLLAALLTVLTAVAVRPLPGGAEVSLPPTDVVLAIDQSGSTEQSDPTDQRIEAARQFVDTAAVFADAYPVRVGFVSFGSPQFPGAVRLERALTPVTTPGLRDVFQPSRVQGTDFEAALCLAWSVAAQQPGGPGCPEVPVGQVRVDGGAPRSRAVVLITDGFPAPDGKDVAFASGEAPIACSAGSSSGHAYMCRLHDHWRALNAQTPVSLYVIGIDRDNRWFPSTQSYWSELLARRYRMRQRDRLRHSRAALDGSGNAGE